MERRFNGRFFALPDWEAYIWKGLYMEGLIFGILRHFAKKQLLQYLRLNVRLLFFCFVFLFVCLFFVFFFAVLSLQFVFNPLSPNIRIQIPQTDLYSFS